MRGIRVCYRLIFLAAHIVLGVVCCVLLLPKQQQTAKHWQKQVVSWWLHACARIMGVTVQVHGRPVEQVAYLVSNHVSWLDILVIGSTQPVCFLAKSEISRWPLIGYLARRAGTLFIQRGQGAQSAAQALANCLRHGYSVAVFPEGTTSDGTQVKPFYPRLFSVIENQQVLVQPLALGYPHNKAVHPGAPFLAQEAFLKNLIYLIGFKKLLAVVHYTAPLAKDGDRKKLAEQAHTQVSHAMQKIYC